MKKRLCRNFSCGKELPVHLTSAYHCNKECYKQAKKIRQKKVDDLIKAFRKGIYSNYKLFEELLPYSGRCIIDVTEARVKGFDEHAYYGTLKDPSNNIWYTVGNYHFYIKDNTPSKLLTIYKK